VHLDEGFHGSTFGEDGFDVLREADVVELPEIDVVGVEELEGLFDHAKGGFTGALLRLGGDEGFVAAVLQDAADVLLAPALGASVDGGGVDVVDTEVEGALDDGDGVIEVIGFFECCLTAQGENAYFVAGFAEIAGGHGGQGLWIGRQGGKLVCGGLCAVGEKSCGQGSAGFEELATVGGDRWLLHFGDLGAANALLRANYMAEAVYGGRCC